MHGESGRTVQNRRLQLQRESKGQAGRRQPVALQQQEEAWAASPTFCVSGGLYSMSHLASNAALVAVKPAPRSSPSMLSSCHSTCSDVRNGRNESHNNKTKEKRQRRKEKKRRRRPN